MTELEQFYAGVQGKAEEAGVTPREFSEATGPVAATAPMLAAMEHENGALLLLGKPGTGKTLAATRWLLRPICNPSNWIACNGWWRPRRPTSEDSKRSGADLWRTARSLARIQQYDEAAVEKLLSARRLVLDDLGQEYLDKGGFLASLIDEIVTERHRRELATVMTSNTTPAEFTERYGHRVLDRIVDTGRMVLCDGESMRRSPATDRSLPPIITLDAVRARIAAQEAERQRRREQEEQERAAIAPRVPIEVPPPPPKAPPMTPDEVAARKVEIARQLDEWTARNGGASA
jgi:hypothetical protein